MSYRVLIMQVERIASPIKVYIENNVLEFSSGEFLAKYEFDKNYVVDTISAENENIVIKLKINDKVNDTNWNGEEQVSFT